MDVELVKVSSRGQFVLPLSIRKRFGISKGEKLMLIEKDGAITLKPVKQLKKDIEEEIYLMLRAEKGWNLIREGKAKKMAKNDFLKELSAW
jgi:AbrB family looped-hinge helix DNA binding protein